MNPKTREFIWYCVGVAALTAPLLAILILGTNPN